MVFIALPVSTVMSSDVTPQSWTKIQQAIEKGDASALAEHFASSITLSVPGHKGSFSIKQAKVIMQNFFRDYPAGSFSSRSNGVTSRNAPFLLGKYTTSNKEEFSVYILVSNDKTSAGIIQLTFEKS